MTSWYQSNKHSKPVVGAMPGLTPTGQPLNWMKQSGKGKQVDVTLVSPTAAEDARQRELAKRKKHSGKKIKSSKNQSPFEKLYNIY